MKKIQFVSLTAILLSPLTTLGYELSTHAVLTRVAYCRSTLSTTVLTQLGFAGDSNLGDLYLDIAADGTVTVRNRDPGQGGKTGAVKFTEGKFNDANNPLSGESCPITTMQSPEGWLMVGAIREDDVKYDKGVKEEYNPPQDDPQGAFNRLYNHFYDPFLGGIPLQGGPISGVAAPDWAIDGKGLPFKQDNHFSIKNAREAMFRAATLRTLDNGQLKALNTPQGESLNEQQQRLAYWATAFRSLGDVSHLLQDMAQPQHTRNDWHAGTGCLLGENSCIAGQSSFYELYLEARVVGAHSFSLPKQTIPGQKVDYTNVSPSFTLPAPDYGSYTIPRFNSFMDYYTGGIDYASYTATGLANYSNMGFYSVGTNLNSLTHHDLPPNDTSDKSVLRKYDETIAPVQGMDGKDIANSAPLTLIRYPVTDNLVASETTIARLSSHSVFDKFLTAKGKDEVYSLNYYNYDAQAKLLLPRATSYTAGLIDYFFRGKMEISLPDEGVYGVVDHAKFTGTDAEHGFKGFGKIKLKLKNTMDKDESGNPYLYPDTMGAGVLVATLKFYRNKEYTDDLKGELSVGDTQADIDRKKTNVEEMVTSDAVSLSSLAPGEDTELTFNFPQELPINAWSPVKLSVVFRGKLGGEEDAVIVSEKKISSPIFFSVFNEMDYVSIYGACFTKAQLLDPSDDNVIPYWNSLRTDCKTPTTSLVYAWQSRDFLSKCKSEDLGAATYTYSSSSMGGASWDFGALQTSHFGRIAFLMGDEITSIANMGVSWEGVSAGAFDGSPLGVVDYGNNSGKYFQFRDYRGVRFSTAALYHMNGLGSSASPGMGCAGFYMNDPANAEGPVPATTLLGGW